MIQDAILALAANRTVIIIAHRLSTVQDADKIYVMQEGSVTEAGTHKQLMDVGGLYASLYNLQFKDD